MFQLIRGGRDTGLQVKPTLAVLAALAQRGLVETTAREELAAAYDFLRRLEHRLQYLELMLPLKIQQLHTAVQEHTRLH